MSATLGILLKEVFPDVHIDIFERLSSVAQESSDAWNNAGTGHSAFCELNYTPEREDGSIDISKALKIAESFELSKAFWANLMQRGYFDQPESFINNLPHISFVWGKDGVEFLQKRYHLLKEHPLFSDMLYSESVADLEAWIPLVMEGRGNDVPLAATYMKIGTDVDFGHLTRCIFDKLIKLPNVNLHLEHEIQRLKKTNNGQWEVNAVHLPSDESSYYYSDFVFIGAGGGTLPLLDAADIDEAKGYGGFPVGGQWLVCDNPKVIERHHAKVYGKAAVGAPPMSVPHLDSRMIDGKKALLFGPFAGFSTKFLKNGSYFDLPTSIEPDNFFSMLGAGWHNIPLTVYLLEQVVQSQEDRIEALREYFPNVNAEDWRLEVAGQRVQVIKKDEEEGGKLEFGTEIVAAQDGSIAGLLGASPGASTAVYIMTETLKKCFPEHLNDPDIRAKLATLLPTFENSPVDWCIERKKSNAILHLDD